MGRLSWSKTFKNYLIAVRSMQQKSKKGYMVSGVYKTYDNKYFYVAEKKKKNRTTRRKKR